MKLAPVALILLGLAGGGFAGFRFAPKPEPDAAMAAAACADGATACAEAPAETQAMAAAVEPPAAGPDAAYDYVTLNKQFVVPVVSGGAVSSLIVVSISLEIVDLDVETVYSREPKLRDRFLEVLFEHANSGGFDGRFTDRRPMRDVRANLLRAARQVLGEDVNDVLLTDIIRQDL